MVSMHVDWVQSLLLENLGYGAMVCPRNYQQFVIHETVTQFPPYGQDACIHHCFAFENVIQSETVQNLLHLIKNPGFSLCRSWRHIS